MSLMTKKKSKSHLGQQTESSDRPNLAVAMDYSNTYRENDELDNVLEEQLDDIHKNQYRMWTEKSAQLKQIRRQVEVIVRLRQAVNSRKPGESIEIVSNARPRRYSRQYSTVKADEKTVDPIDVDEIAKATKTQMRISQEREKFSSKNLFNVLRRSSGFGGGSSPIGNNSNSNANSNNNSNRLFAPRKSIVGAHNNMNSVSLPDGMDRTADSTRTGARHRPETAHALRGDNRRGTVTLIHSAAAGRRPKTAVEITRYSRQNNLLPPRVPSARRSRSRRELELLSRAYSDLDDSSLDVEDIPEWDVIRENQRKQKLQQLRNQRQHLDVKVQRFLDELEKFNNPKKVQSSLVLYADD